MRCVAVSCSDFGIGAPRLSVVDDIQGKQRLWLILVLQCATVWCSVMQCVAVSCSELQWFWCATRLSVVDYISKADSVLLLISVLQCAAMCCSAMQCDTMCCNMLHWVAVRCSNFASDATRLSVADYIQRKQRALCCSVLQCVAVCCSVLQCVAACCSFLHCDAVRRSVTQCVLQCVVLCCSATQCVAVCCSEMQCGAVCCSVLQWLCVSLECSFLSNFGDDDLCVRACLCACACMLHDGSIARVTWHIHTCDVTHTYITSIQSICANLYANQYMSQTNICYEPIYVTNQYMLRTNTY